MISVTPKALADSPNKIDLSNLSPEQVALSINNLNLFYGDKTIFEYLNFL